MVQLLGMGCGRSRNRYSRIDALLDAAVIIFGSIIAALI
jgi:hypothetical protein